MGCEEDRPNNGLTFMDVPGVGDITRCPLAMIDGETSMVLKLYSHYKNGYLPDAGGINDQPASLIKAFEIIESATNLAREKLQEDG